MFIFGSNHIHATHKAQGHMGAPSKTHINIYVATVWRGPRAILCDLQYFNEANTVENIAPRGSGFHVRYRTNVLYVRATFRFLFHNIYSHLGCILKEVIARFGEILRATSEHIQGGCRYAWCILLRLTVFVCQAKSCLKRPAIRAKSDRF